MLTSRYVAGASMPSGLWASRSSSRYSAPSDAARPQPEMALKLPVEHGARLRALAEDPERKQTLFAGDVDAPESSEGRPGTRWRWCFKSVEPTTAASVAWLVVGQF